MVGEPVVSVEFVITGPRLDEADRIATSLRGSAPVVAESLDSLPYVELQSLGDAVSAPGSARRYWKSSAFTELPDELLEAFLERGVETASSAEDCGMELVAAFGGAVSTVGEDDTAFGPRRAQVDFLALGRWADPAEDDRYIELCRQNWSALSRFSDAGVYVNNLGREDRVREAYGDARYRRLVELKDRFDPANVFHLNANIAPSALP
jgi:hypothetical protein